MFVLRLPLKATEMDRREIGRRFNAVSHIHNVCVKHARKLLRKLEHDPEYCSCLAEYSALLKKKKRTEKDAARKKALSKRMNGIRESIGLSESGLQSYLRKCGSQFAKMLSSQQVQKEATRVWRGVSDILFREGKELHFKKRGDFRTIGGKSNENGVIMDADKCTIEWLGLEIKCRMAKRPCEYAYQIEALDNKVSYCEIERKMFPNGWHYYVLVYLSGDAPKRLAAVGDRDNVCGIDIGVSTVAAVSEYSILLRELAPDVRKYNRQIIKLQQKLDASKRASNPNKFNSDGTYKKGNKDRWKLTNAYFKNRRKLTTLYRQKSAYIRQCHEQTANELLAGSACFLAEEMSFAGLQRRSKKTERQGKASEIKQKDGSTKTVHKYKKKKRYGRSLNNRAPAEFVTILTRKAKAYGGGVWKVNTKKFKASQYDHVTGKCTKAGREIRSKTIGGHEVQRDLYSAFLIKSSNITFTEPDREKCNQGFERFCKMSDFLIADMKSRGISMKQCFGF